MFTMGKNTSIILGDHFEQFINQEITSGKYSSASEVIRSALRLLEDEKNKVNQLRKALEEGEKSGFIDNFDSDQFLNELKNKTNG